MLIPSSTRKRADLAERLVNECLASRGRREKSYRDYGQWIERGWATSDGQTGMALTNVLYSHDDRVAAYLFSPVDLHFGGDFERHYDALMHARMAVAARLVTREWERKSLGMAFGQGVRIAVDYGACIFKQIVERDENGHGDLRGARNVPPWMFGVLNEGINDLDQQEAFVEVQLLSKYEIWRRIRHLPDAEKKYKTILASGNKDTGIGIPSSMVHYVLSTTVLDLSPAQNNAQPRSGGWVQTGGGGFPIPGPEVAGDLYPFYEAWVWDDEASDYVMFQWMEPNILVAPVGQPKNWFVKHYHPYRLIQANTEPGYFWGRSEVADLMRLQGWLTTHCADIANIMGKQFDMLWAFASSNGITDENYMAMKSVGFVDLGPGGSATNMTPKLPPEAIPLVREILYLMNYISGFPPIMSGAGEQGVRSGTHADTLVKTGSPRLRDRSLQIEWQAAGAGDATLALLQAKDDSTYWTDYADPKSDFKLADIPDDRRIVVDSHSSSPVFQDDHLQLIAWGVKAGIIDPITAVEMLPFGGYKDTIIQRLKEKQAQQAQLMKRLEQEDPEAFVKLLTGSQHKGGRKAA